MILKAAPEAFFAFYREKMDFRTAKPNIVHQKLAQLEHDGILKGIVTQNIDGLHQAAGSRTVYEIHGTAATAHCEGCHKAYPGDIAFDRPEPVPRCECGGIIRPDIVLYNEKLPIDQLDGAITLLQSTDLLIVASTSLAVGSAAALVKMFYGEHLVIVNRDETAFDQYADIVFREDMVDVFRQL